VENGAAAGIPSLPRQPLKEAGYGALRAQNHTATSLPPPASTRERLELLAGEVFPLSNWEQLAVLFLRNWGGGRRKHFLGIRFLKVKSFSDNLIQ
jgi:hypothetical protein